MLVKIKIVLQTKCSQSFTVPFSTARTWNHYLFRA